MKRTHQHIIYSFIFLVMLVGCSKILIQPAEYNHTILDFEAAWEAIDLVYPLLEYKGIDWDNVYVNYSQRAEQSRGDEGYQLIYDLLRELQDPHVYFVNPGGGIVFPYPGHRWIKDYKAYDRAIVRRYFDEPLLLACQEKVEYGILNDNIGYIYISNFDDADAFNDFGEVIDQIHTTTGLIIDVRHNSGGWTDNVSDVIGKFITDSLTFVQGYVKDGIKFNKKAVQPDKAIVPYLGPIVLLMNGACISAGEIFSEMMNQLPNVTLVGDTTNGAGCNDAADYIEGDYTLPSGIRIHIGTTYAVRYDGQPIELNGIVPEILLPQENYELENGKDIQLEFAKQFLLL